MRKVGALLLAGLLACLTMGAGAEIASETWARITQALLSRQENPVPEECRLSLRPGALNQAAGLDDNWLNLVLMSTDAPDMARNFGRTDVLLLCSVHKITGEVYLAALPETARFSCPELPGPLSLRYANCFGGPALVLRSVNGLMGLNAEKYCAVNEAAFCRAVDALGGIRLALDAEEAERLMERAAAGTYALNGEQALRYVRLRRAGAEANRLRLLQAALAQALAGSGVDRLFSLADALLPLMDTNLTGNDLMDILFALSEADMPQAFHTASLSLLPGEEYALNPADVRAYREALYGKEEKQ